MVFWQHSWKLKARASSLWRIVVCTNLSTPRDLDWTLSVVRVHLVIGPYSWVSTSLLCTLCGCKQSSCSSTKWWSNLQCFLLSSCCTMDLEEHKLLQLAWMQLTAGALCLGWTVLLLCCSMQANASGTKIVPILRPHLRKKKKTWSPTQLTLRSQGRQNMYSPKKRWTIIVLCFSSPVAANVHRWNNFNCIHEKLRDCKRSPLQLHVPPLQLILNVPPLQLIRPPVSGLPAAPTCQQGLVIMTSSYQSPTPFSTHVTLLSCNSHGHSAWFLLLFLPRACANHIFYAWSHQLRRSTTTRHFWLLARAELPAVFRYHWESVGCRVHFEIAFVYAGPCELKAKRISGGTTLSRWGTSGCHRDQPPGVGPARARHSHLHQRFRRAKRSQFPMDQCFYRAKRSQFDLPGEQGVPAKQASVLAEKTQFLAKFVPQSSLVSCAFLLFTTVTLWDGPVYKISKTSSRRAQRMNFEYRLLYTVPDFRATLKLSRDVHSEPVTDIPTGICFSDHTSVLTFSLFQTSASLVIFLHFQRRPGSLLDLLLHANHKRCTKGLLPLPYVRVHLFSSRALRPSETQSIVLEEGSAKAPVLLIFGKETRHLHHRTQQRTHALTVSPGCPRLHAHTFQSNLLALDPLPAVRHDLRVLVEVPPWSRRTPPNASRSRPVSPPVSSNVQPHSSSPSPVLPPSRGTQTWNCPARRSQRENTRSHKRGHGQCNRAAGSGDLSSTCCVLFPQVRLQAGLPSPCVPSSLHSRFDPPLFRVFFVFSKRSNRFHVFLFLLLPPPVTQTWDPFSPPPPLVTFAMRSRRCTGRPSQNAVWRRHLETRLHVPCALATRNDCEVAMNVAQRTLPLLVLGERPRERHPWCLVMPSFSQSSFGQFLFWPTFFWPIPLLANVVGWVVGGWVGGAWCGGWVGGGWVGGGSAGPPSAEPPCPGPPPSDPPQSFALFFHSPAPTFAVFSLSGVLLVSFFLSLGVFSWNFGGQPENSKRAHLRVPAHQKTPPKFHEKTHREKTKTWEDPR